MFAQSKGDPSAAGSLPGSLVLTVLRGLFKYNSYLMLFVVGVSFRISYFIVSYLYVSCSG